MDQEYIDRPRSGKPAGDSPKNKTVHEGPLKVAGKAGGLVR